LKILDEWVSNKKWKIKKCFLVGPTWLEELKSPKQAKLVIDFPFLNKIRRLLKRLHKRLSIPLDEPEFIVLLLRKID